MALIASDKKRVVIGLGKTGLSCARFFRSKCDEFVMMDTRKTPPGLDEFRREFPDIKILCGELDEDYLLNASEIIVSPGVSLRDPALLAAKNTGIKIIGDIEIFATNTQKPVVAITGSNAKSTVTTLVGKMASAAGLSVAVGGNLGTPALDILDDKNIDCYVLELSSFQLETTYSLRAHVATVLNISADHMDRYDTLQAYTLAKHRIYRGAHHAVFNRSDKLTYPLLGKKQVSWSFGLDAGDRFSVGMQNMAGENWLVRNMREPLMRTSDLQLPGMHNVENVAAALTIASAAGWDISACVSTAKQFTGLAHRCQFVAKRNDVSFFNDSKGTNIGATVAAITGLALGQKNIVLIAGGQGKGADFLDLSSCVSAHVKHLVLIGCDADLIAASCADTPNIKASSMEDAVQKAERVAERGDIVLLSPACASFDMFKNYEDRGTQFCEAVEAAA